MKKSPPDLLILIIGILFPLFMVLALPEMYFHKDLEILWKWAHLWSSNWQQIYINCSECNYPFLGMVSSAGLLNLLRSPGDRVPVFAYRFLLSLLDGLNIYILYWILSKLKVARSAYVAGIIGISISSWAGGAVWGQIDGVSQFFILISLAWVVNKNSSPEPTHTTYRLYVVISSLLLAFSLLTKQLTIFSAFSIGLLLIADIAFHNRTNRSFFQFAGLALITFMIAVFAWDPFLALKPPYISHLVYIWQEGIFQNGIISGNGFNIWMLLGRDMWSSAFVSFVPGSWLLNPYRMGQVFFLLFTGLITLSLLLWLRPYYYKHEKQLNREILLNFILHLALVNLCFNVFLSGTRERYLFHFYPYIILAWIGLGEINPLFSSRVRSLLFLGANLYGLFVLQIASTLDFRIGTSTHQLMAIFHLGLVACLLFIVFKYQRLATNLKLIFGKGL